MASSTVYLEEAVTLRDDLAAVLRSPAPETFADFENLEYCIEAAAETEASLRESGLPEAVLLASSLQRIRSALESVKSEAVSSESIRSEAVRALLRRYPGRQAEADASASLVAVANPSALPADARFLVLAGKVASGYVGGYLAELPAWFVRTLPPVLLTSAGFETVTDRARWDDLETRETALRLWDPGSLTPMGSFAAALETASMV